MPAPTNDFFDIAQMRRQEAERLASQVEDKPVIVLALPDIVRLIADFAPTTREKMIVVAQVDQKVSADLSGHDRRAVLLAGFDIVKNQAALKKASAEAEPIIVDGKPLYRPPVAQDSVFWLDTLLKKWLDAYRDGLAICWNLGDVVYKYDIYNHKLFKVTNDKAKDSAS